MDSFYNSPNLASFLKTQGTNVAGTLRLSRKNVPSDVKEAKLKKGEVIASHSDGLIVMKRKDKKNVAMISTFHDASMVTQQLLNEAVHNSLVIYNSQTIAMDSNLLRQYLRHMEGQ